MYYQNTFQCSICIMENLNECVSLFAHDLGCIINCYKNKVPPLIVNAFLSLSLRLFAANKSPVSCSNMAQSPMFLRVMNEQAGDSWTPQTGQPGSSEQEVLGQREKMKNQQLLQVAALLPEKLPAFPWVCLSPCFLNVFLTCGYTVSCGPPGSNWYFFFF